MSVARGSVIGVRADDPSTAQGDGVIRSRAAAEAYVASVCFKHGPPSLVGVEIEWMFHHPDRPGEPVDPDTLRAALGAHTPPALEPSSLGQRLPAGGVVTVEPGVYLPGRGGVSIEDSGVIRADGYDVLTMTSKDLTVLA